MNQPKPSKQLDLQGIRALVIIAVLGFHFFPEYCLMVILELIRMMVYLLFDTQISKPKSNYLVLSTETEKDDCEQHLLMEKLEEEHITKRERSEE
ncbi:hypothetical protein CAEBREN_31466 [Caenorhabditis brenneri]|uniref:Uncharacterized protein n=1 Tax=Caenorhabditis brenneri TaxID=135651 RepID=G0P759_CAEBE|nr:hypothetical protein CAEBREN_31466 [Caenorhabditis brenneri]